jgi:hypothetical protein
VGARDANRATNPSAVVTSDKESRNTGEEDKPDRGHWCLWSAEVVTTMSTIVTKQKKLPK